MEIYINDTLKTCQEGITISELLVQENVQPINIAIAVDETVISKKLWDTTKVTPGAKIIIIKAVQGG